MTNFELKIKNIPIKDLLTSYSKEAIILREKFILHAIIGSYSHNTYIPSNDPNSIDDIDIMGITCMSPRFYCSLNNFEGMNFFQNEYDIIIYDIKKLFRLLLKNNPNVLGLLWLKPEFYLKLDNKGKLLIKNRDLFSSKLAYKSFCGYANGQIKKMKYCGHQGYMGNKRKVLVKKYGYDVKNASHVIRLLKMGVEFLIDGKLNVFRDKDREELIDIKIGKWSLKDVKNYAESLLNDLHKASKSSNLPDKPNFEKINNLLIKIIYPISDYLKQS